jgi:hypothetical protein
VMLLQGFLNNIYLVHRTSSDLAINPSLTEPAPPRSTIGA